MKKNVKPRRTYHSTRRTQQASQTQRDIVEAARQLFLKQGYAATSIAQIALTAGVSVEAIYATFGSKRAPGAGGLGQGTTPERPAVVQSECIQAVAPDEAKPVAAL